MIPVGGIGFNGIWYIEEDGILGGYSGKDIFFEKKIPEIFFWKGSKEYLEKIDIENPGGIMHAALTAFCLFHFKREQNPKEKIIIYTDIHNEAAKNLAKNAGFEEPKETDEENIHCKDVEEGKKCYYQRYKLKKEDMLKSIRQISSPVFLEKDGFEEDKFKPSNSPDSVRDIVGETVFVTISFSLFIGYIIFFGKKKDKKVGSTKEKTSKKGHKKGKKTKSTKESSTKIG